MNSGGMCVSAVPARSSPFIELHDDPWNPCNKTSALILFYALLVCFITSISSQSRKARKGKNQFDLFEVSCRRVACGLGWMTGMGCDFLWVSLIPSWPVFGLLSLCVNTRGKGLIRCEEMLVSMVSGLFFKAWVLVGIKAKHGFYRKQSGLQSCLGCISLESHRMSELMEPVALVSEMSCDRSRQRC